MRLTFMRQLNRIVDFSEDKFEDSPISEEPHSAICRAYAENLVYYFQQKQICTFPNHVGCMDSKLGP